MRRFAAACLACCGLALMSPAAATQDENAQNGQTGSNTDFMAMSEQAIAAFARGDYLRALEVFGDPDAIPADSPAQSPWQQVRPAFDGFVVGADNRRSVLEPLGPEETARFAALERRDAIAAIVERARDTRIVIINETHDNPRDRAFIMDVAEALRPLGFTHFAAETLSPCCYPEQEEGQMEALQQRGYPLFKDGFYSAEPMFGYMLRRVLAAGYQPVSYEWMVQADERPSSRLESIAVRDATQARNLAQALEAAGPEAKFLIHVGYSHAAERPFPDGSEWMALRLSALTGIDPLTVNQTDLSQYAMRREYAAIGMEQGARSAVIFENGQPAHIGYSADLMDLQVVHPPITSIGGRPDWLARTGRTALQLGADMVPEEGRNLVQVFLPGEDENAVPLDQVLIEAGDTPPLVYVPRNGEYRLVVLGS